MNDRPADQFIPDSYVPPTSASEALERIVSVSEAIDSIGVQLEIKSKSEFPDNERLIEWQKKARGAKFWKAKERFLLKKWLNSDIGERVMKAIMDRYSDPISLEEANAWICSVLDKIERLNERLAAASPVGEKTTLQVLTEKASLIFDLRYAAAEKELLQKWIRDHEPIRSKLPVQAHAVVSVPLSPPPPATEFIDPSSVEDAKDRLHKIVGEIQEIDRTFAQLRGINGRYKSSKYLQLMDRKNQLTLENRQLKRWIGKNAVRSIEVSLKALGLDPNDPICLLAGARKIIIRMIHQGASLSEEEQSIMDAVRLALDANLRRA